MNCSVFCLVAAGLLQPACFNVAGPRPTTVQAMKPLDRSLIEVGPSLKISDEFQPVQLPLGFSAFIKATQWDVAKDSVAFVLYKNGVKVGPLVTHKEDQQTTISAGSTATELGVYRIDVLLGTEALGSVGFSIAHVPGLGSGLMVLVGGDGHADLRFRQPDTATLEIHRWESTYESHAYYVEWRHDGKVAFTDKGRSTELDEWIRSLEERFSDPDTFSKQHLNARMYSSLERYTMPPKIVKQPGVWDVVVLRDQHAPLAASFTVTPKGELAGSLPISIGNDDVWQEVALTRTTPASSADLDRKLKSVRPWKHADVSEGWQMLPVTSEEIRALYRSPELYEARRAFNDKISPHGAARAELSADDRRRLTTDQQDRLIRKTEHEANVESGANTRADRTDATRDIPRLRQLIKQHSAPFSADEQPSPRD